MKNYKRVASFLFPIMSLFTFSQVNAEQIPSHFQTCIACHGDKGQGNPALNAPVIAGQSVDYLTRQLSNFATGKRGAHEKDMLGKQMVAFSQSVVNGTELTALVEYINKLPKPSLEKAIEGDMKNGSRYYQAKCGACHGGKAEGNPVFKAPRLSQQDIDYIRRQMSNFTEGVRGTHKEDKLGRQMAMMAKTVSGKELEDILFFISQQ